MAFLDWASRRKDRSMLTWLPSQSFMGEAHRSLSTKDREILKLQTVLIYSCSDHTVAIQYTHLYIQKRSCLYFLSQLSPHTLPFLHKSYTWLSPCKTKPNQCAHNLFPSPPHCLLLAPAISLSYCFFFPSVFLEKEELVPPIFPCIMKSTLSFPLLTDTVLTTFISSLFTEEQLGLL